eukprot:CAMPEP_0203894138 /NCGR_PEP_ID=MMETSP0359-20131031/37131_1 /ASSEMBLY_ACC=CAM_ASM_000338 /TAXON_ID=268821 /ORGANISM="Scrippsiella Hangoei, Strain SHTV-5" /LENGTH=407 /DNA_ID=CAMNT_0050816393 /DNA_START=184 /DNA_END=1408 /DNA_ORIENTATION=-
MAKFNLNVLVPCLILSSVGSKLQLEELTYLWPLLVWSAAQVVLGLLVATLLLRALEALLKYRGVRGVGLSKRLVRVLPVIATVQNSICFPLPLMQTVCKGVGAELGNCFDDVVLYMFVYSIVWQVFLWTVVYALLQAVAQSPSEHLPALQSPLNMPVSFIGRRASSELLAIEGVTIDQAAEGTVAATVQGLWRALLDKIRLIVNPVLCALAAAVAVAASPTLQSALFVDNDNPLRTLGDALSHTGAVVPVFGAMLLSASLGRAMRAQSQQRDSSDGASSAGLEVVPWWATSVVILVRLLLVPGLGLCADVLLKGIPGGSPFPLNKTMRVLVMLEFASPSATISIVLCHSLGMGDLAESLATMYVPMYAVSLVTVPIWLSTALIDFDDISLACSLAHALGWMQSCGCK